LFIIAFWGLVVGSGPAWAFSFFGEKTVEVTFTCPRSARKVCLAGDFNAWSPQTHCLKKERGVWTIRLKLKPGRYAYAFVLDDDKWIPDPGAMLLEDDGFGRKNSILIIK
jgi:1,4-alpha-glucan branching enzyme